MSEVVIDPRDQKYFVEKPDASFSPQRNAQVMKEIHEDTAKYFAGLRRKQVEDFGERLDILASFADYKFNKGMGKNFEGYVGKSLRTRLIGEKILEKVRVLSSVDRLRGNTKIQL